MHVKEQYSKPKRLGRALASAASVAAVCLFASAPASAHFILETPASLHSQDSLGNPQKVAPCGDDSSGMPTGAVTAFVQGETITITINETIFHPGHYRIALAVNDRSELPPEPLVTVGSTDCGSAEIQSSPIFPVLADGVLEHSAPFDGPQTIEVKLPSDVTCDKCTLQVLEFMAIHGLNDPGGCYYHHCANISISAVTSGEGASSTSTTTGAGGSPASGTGGGSPDDDEEASSSGDCGCSMPGVGTREFGGIGSLLAVATLLRRRRGRFHK